MEPGWDGDVELHEGGNWDVGLCTGVGGSGGIDGSVGWMVLMVCVVVGVVVSTVIVQTVLVEVDCVGVVSESISRGFMVVAAALDDFGLVL